MTEEIINKLNTVRIDIKNRGEAENAVKVEAENSRVSTPAWFTNAQGIGQMLVSENRQNKVKITAVKDGKLLISFKGMDCRFEEKRFPVWIDYKSIKINGKEILSESAQTWHDKPFRYEMPVKDGEEVLIEYETQPHPYEYNELRETVAKLNIKAEILVNDDVFKPFLKPAAKLEKQPERYKIIAVRGYYFTGSSAVIGFFHEFDNVSTIGYCDNIYSVTNVKSGCEITFFTGTNFWSFVDSFYSNNLLEKDFIIKKFIQDIYRYYDNKGGPQWEKNPLVYSDTFLSNSLKLLFSVLELDEYTVKFMQKERFPIRWNSKDEKFNNCSFMHGKRESQYLFYQFKNMSADEFKEHVAVYVNSIFDIIPRCGKDYLVCDQLLQTDRYPLLDGLNGYLIGKSLKEICVMRDPRDRFMSAYRTDVGGLPRNIDQFVTEYKRKYSMWAQTNPNRLSIRFEDLVLKYEETTQKIMEFIGMDASHHIAPKSVFDPAISVVNVGGWKQFIDQEFMKQIEERLSEYCYYPEKEHLTEEALKLLKGQGNG